MNDFMTVKIKDKALCLDSRTIKLMADITIELDRLESPDHSRGRRGFEDAVLNEVSRAVSSEFLAKYSSTVLESINIDEIIKRVKLNIIQGIATN